MSTRLPPRPTPGVQIRLDRLTGDEIRHLATIDATTEEGRRIRARAGAVLCAPSSDYRRGHGRWPLLEWFAREERIMSKVELAEALSRLT